MLTKTDFLRFRQCPRQLWLHKNRKDLLPDQVDAGKQLVFDNAFEVEDQAYRLFPDGASAYDGQFGQALKKTESLLRRRLSAVFQPTFSRGQLFCRCDILAFDPKRQVWDIYEVKSSTDVKEEHLYDLAFQDICLREAGLPVGRLHIIHINNQYVRQGEIDPRQLLKTVDRTDEARTLTKEVERGIKSGLEVLKLVGEPEVRILKQCSDPYDCPFIPYCWRRIPDHSVYDMNLAEEKLREMLDEGIMLIQDMPDGLATRVIKRRYAEALKSGKPLIEAEAIRTRLADMRYPLHFLDYETYSAPIPPFDGYRPYQQIPFQYSLDVKRLPDARLEHYEFLAAEPGDPVPALSAALAQVIGPKGSIVSWNAAFEAGRNEEMAVRQPQLRGFLASVNSRMFDPMMIFRDGEYADAGFRGSASLKAVLPVLVPELSYGDLAIQEGGTAAASWPKLVGGTLSPEEKEQLYRDMLAYCGRDTLAMVRIVEILEKI